MALAQLATVLRRCRFRYANEDELQQGIAAALTVHGFRTTFRTWAQEETDFEEEIVEHCLHHITGDDAEKAYKRGEALRKRRIVMQAFANFATRQSKNNVTSMRAA